MTTIIIRKNHEGIYRGFYCMGHAEYTKKRLFGKEPDILCAAISVTVQEYDHGVGRDDRRKNAADAE